MAVGKVTGESMGIHLAFWLRLDATDLMPSPFGDFINLPVQADQLEQKGD